MVKTHDLLKRPVTGRLILPENLHITLHFIGSVTEEVKTCLHQAALSVVAEPFDIRLERFGYFDKAKIFWMAPKTIPPALSSLHERLGSAFASCGYKSDSRPYSPHVSLLRKAKSTPLQYPEFTIDWQVDDFVLVESVSTADGVEYNVIERYPLQK